MTTFILESKKSVKFERETKNEIKMKEVAKQWK